MTIYEDAKRYNDYIISMRRYFHENPELSGKEINTMKVIGEELSKIGIDYVEVENGGILAKITGPKPGRTVLLRADCDALPVQEKEVNLSCKRTCVSKNPGVMHACGHDSHMAMLLGTAKILKDKQDEIEGTVYLCFERSEEGASNENAKYLFAYIEKNGIHIDSAYGTHLLSTMETGKLAINDEGMMAGVLPFDITIEGRGGHGSRPDQSINPIDAFTAIYQGMNALRLTRVDPYKTLTYSVGVLEGGAVANVIPQPVRFAGTMRTFDVAGRGMVFHDEFKKIVDNTCRAYNCTPTYNRYTKPNLPVVNYPVMAKFARDVIGKEIGRENVCQYEPWMASESFGQYIYMWPGVFAFLGMKNPEKGIGAAHHNQNFDIDEDVLFKGRAASATYAIEFLKQGPDTKGMARYNSFKDLLKFLEREKEIPELYGE